jgi:hypothetical protein
MHKQEQCRKRYKQLAVRTKPDENYEIARKYDQTNSSSALEKQYN